MSATLCGNVDDHCPGCGTRLGDIPEDPVMLPRAQHEALMAMLPHALAAKLLLDRIELDAYADACEAENICHGIEETFAALRAAGIDLEDKT